MRALIIDDDQISRKLLDTIMRNAGFSTDQAADGVEAFEYVNKNEPYEVLLVDWDMPRMDGLQFIQKLIEYNKVKHSKIFMITCHDTMEDAMTATALGIDGYLVKPIEVEKINRLLISFGFLKDEDESVDESESEEKKSD